MFTIQATRTTEVKLPLTFIFQPFPYYPFPPSTLRDAASLKPATDPEVRSLGKVVGGAPADNELRAF